MARILESFIENKKGEKVLVIRIPVDTLAFAAQRCPDLAVYDQDICDWLSPRVTDNFLFAVDVLSALQDENEDGSTLITKMIDNVIVMAADNGSEGIKLPNG